MKNINSYSFVDCFFVDFSVDRILSRVSIVLEAYYPILPDGTRNKGLIELSFEDISTLTMIKSEEFNYDISLDYSPIGEDVKANEIYSVEILHIGGMRYTISIKSDMIQMKLECENYILKELNGLTMRMKQVDYRSVQKKEK